jgi:hypothetical protein
MDGKRRPGHEHDRCRHRFSPVLTNPLISADRPERLSSYSHPRGEGGRSRSVTQRRRVTNGTGTRAQGVRRMA